MVKKCQKHNCWLKKMYFVREQWSTFNFWLSCPIVLFLTPMCCQDSVLCESVWFWDRSRRTHATPNRRIGWVYFGKRKLKYHLPVLNTNLVQTGETLCYKTGHVRVKVVSHASVSVLSGTMCERSQLRRNRVVSDPLKICELHFLNFWTQISNGWNSSVSICSVCVNKNSK